MTTVYVDVPVKNFHFGSHSWEIYQTNKWAWMEQFQHYTFRGLVDCAAGVVFRLHLPQFAGNINVLIAQIDR